TDVCCTSANAVKIVQKIDAPEIIFSPDRNLAAWCARFTDKKIIPWKGFCIVHEKIRAEDIIQAKKNHPEALFIAHPECRADVVDLADRVESTSGMLRFIKSSPVEKFIIGTEEGIITRLRQDSPGKSFFYPGTAPVCANMKKTRLEDVYNALEKMQHEIILPPQIILQARASLDRMLEFSA
ncbi:MAG TPA: quinolinate synthase, partial [Spirochaetia bacterium]|nr:quinolinate synthase [Spirochaetia bacterium]